MDQEQQGSNQHEQYMRLALAEAAKSLEQGEFPVGCVLVLDNEVVGQGRRRNSEGIRSNEVDHAEVVTLAHLLKREPGIDCSRITAYCTMEPCLMCYATLLLSGIRTFVWAYEDVMGGGTSISLQQLSPLYRDMQVKLVPGVLRRESLEMFCRFFEQYSYWQDSLLAEYTLEQCRKEKI